MNDVQKGKNDRAWEELFLRHNILEKIQSDGFYEISAECINTLREARLMTKFDHRINRPDIFKKNNLSVLPITRGTYLIAPFKAYHTFEPTNFHRVQCELPSYIETLNPQFLKSEALVINAAYVSGMLSDFLNDDALKPTISGRMGSGSFSYTISSDTEKKQLELDVKNAQIEVDGGFEGRTGLALIEAKNFISEDFLIRQLYYPYRVFEKQVKKKVRPIFLNYCNGVYYFYEYAFPETQKYNSITLVKQKNYCLEDLSIESEGIEKILRCMPIEPEPSISFPQADNFYRIVNLCELLSQGEKNKDEITQNYAFDKRQTHYYTDAARYLGLVERKNINGEVLFKLTKEGRELFKKSIKERQLLWVGHILKHQIFRDVYQFYHQKGILPSKVYIINRMKESNLYQIHAQSTFERRVYTVLGWLKWIREQR